MPNSFIVRAQEKIVPHLSTLLDTRVIPSEARTASLTFTVLNAGKGQNSVPDLATLKCDRRLVPGETLDEARRQIHEVLEECQAQLGGPEVFRYEYKEDYSTEPVWVDEELELCRIWADSVERVVGQKAGIVCSPGSECVKFSWGVSLAIADLRPFAATNASSFEAGSPEQLSTVPAVCPALYSSLLAARKSRVDASVAQTSSKSTTTTSISSSTTCGRQSR